MALYGKELRESIMRSIANIERCQRDRNERISNWETDEDDCFMSIRIEEHSLHEYHLQLGILDTDGNYKHTRFEYRMNASKGKKI